MASSTNKLIIIAAPSGAGKTSVTRHLLKALPGQLAFSISCATRQPRNNEKEYMLCCLVQKEALNKKRKSRKEITSRNI
jgi:guanylate kinase